jgi:hypothetical protein
MPQCTAKQQYSNGRQCQREAMPGKTKCKAHGSGGVRTAAGRAACATAKCKGKNDTRANRLAYQQTVLELYTIAKLLDIPWIGRPPRDKNHKNLNNATA